MAKLKAAKPADNEFDDYFLMTKEQRLMRLAADWRDADPKHRTFLEGRMLEITVDMEEHPEGFEHGCLCELCRSYGE